MAHLPQPALPLEAAGMASVAFCPAHRQGIGVGCRMTVSTRWRRLPPRFVKSFLLINKTVEPFSRHCDRKNRYRLGEESPRPVPLLGRCLLRSWCLSGQVYHGPEACCEEPACLCCLSCWLTSAGYSTGPLACPCSTRVWASLLCLQSPV